MTYYWQRTDSKIIYALPFEPRFPFAVEPANETTGGSVSVSFFPLLEGSSLIRPAWETTHQVENQQIARAARRLLRIIQEMIESFQQARFDLGYLPPLRAFKVNDGSLLIEWTFRDFRVGFSIEPNPDDSGWYLVSNRNLGEIGASGYTSNMDIETLVSWLLSFVLSNS